MNRLFSRISFVLLSVALAACAGNVLTHELTELPSPFPPTTTQSPATSTPISPTETPAPTGLPGVALTLPVTRDISIAYDRRRGEVLAFGGLGVPRCVPCGETWTWDSAVWTQRHPQNSPPARAGNGLTYDAAREMAVLFGGWDGEKYLNDTWLWDGVNWVEAHPPVSPSPRLDPTLVYDGAWQVVLLFGGSRSVARNVITSFSDTWTWDGQSWTEQPPSEPSNSNTPRPSLAYDIARREVVLWQPTIGTWTWDGRAWIHKQPTASPDLLFEGLLGYNEARKQVILWGCDKSTHPPRFETWAWDGAHWAQLDDHNNPGPTPLCSPDAALLYDPRSSKLLLFSAVIVSKEKGSEQSIWAWTETGWELLFGPAFVQATETVRAVTKLPAQPTATPRVSVSLWSFQWIDEKNGWGIGVGREYLYRTVDGGYTWLDVTPGDRSEDQCLMINSSFFLDEGQAWVVTEDCSSRSGTLYRTQDGGETWESFPTLFLHGSLYFTDSKQGRAAAGRGCRSENCDFELYRTEDGGETWTSCAVRDPYHPGGSQLSRKVQLLSDDEVKFQDQSTIWVGGTGTEGTIVAALSLSRDNGQTWVRQEWPLPEHEKMMAVPFQVGLPVFLNKKEGYFTASYSLAGESGEEGRGVRALFATQDGGQTWEPRSTLLDLGTRLGAIDFVSPLDGFATCAGGLCATHDGGETWLPIPSNLQFDMQSNLTLIAFDFLDTQSGYAIIEELDAALYKTNDGGLTWQVLPSAVITEPK